MFLETSIIAPPKWHLDDLAVFAGHIRVTNTQTDKQTDIYTVHATCVAIDRMSCSARNAVY